jgi:predicted metal-dependent phosphoesterase TrpH
LKKTFADLHIHTSFSDGTFGPQQVIAQADKLGLSSLAITDHECIDGIAPAILAALEHQIEIIPAVELTTEINNIEVHLLGYFIDYKKGWFTKKLKMLCQAREERMQRMVEKLRAAGIDINPEEVLALSGEGSVGRLHIAQILFKKGYVKSVPEAFQKFIGNHSPYYVGRLKLTPVEAIGMIKRIGGLTVLAHPYSLNNDALILDLIREGLEGLEVYYPEHSAAVTAKYLDMTHRYNLLVTGGSDCHGLGKGKMLMGNIKIPYELVDKLKERHNSKVT